MEILGTHSTYSDICILCIGTYSGSICLIYTTRNLSRILHNWRYIYLIKTTQDKEFFSADCRWCWHTAYVSQVVHSCRHRSGLVLNVSGDTTTDIPDRFNNIYNGRNNLLTINMVGRFVLLMFFILIDYTIQHIHSYLGNTRRWNNVYLMFVLHRGIWTNVELTLV